ncbi:MAG: ACP S-malonyltransferase [Candidatus Kapabacteria bacterium]|nr:ACP S-malonyltransferase [Candidatus Kapabacteria bacterium]
MNALLFAGQGSQYVGMTRDLADAYDVARQRLQLADETVGYALSDIMWNGPAERLTETRYTQPALFVHEAIILDLTGIATRASCVAGHSLGEYSALYAAGVLTFTDALSLVQLRANLMFDAGSQTPGTMAAVVGLDDDVVTELCRELDGVDGHRLVAANFNAPGQVVISGSADYLRSNLGRFKEAGAKIVKELQVSGAFHSPLLKSAETPLAERIAATPFEDARIPVYANVTASPLSKADDLKQAITRQLTAPVLWTASLRGMWQDGVRTYTEIGPGKVLQGLVKRTLPEATVSGIDTAADVSGFSTTGDV